MNRGPASHSADMIAVRQKTQSNKGENKPRSGGHEIRSTPRGVHSETPVSSTSLDSNDLITDSLENLIRGLSSSLEPTQIHSLNDILEKVERDLRGADVIGSKKWPMRTELLQLLFKILDLSFIPIDSQLYSSCEAKRDLYKPDKRVKAIILVHQKSASDPFPHRHARYVLVSCASILYCSDIILDCIICNNKLLTRLTSYVNCANNNTNNDTLRAYLQTSMDALLYLYGSLKHFFCAQHQGSTACCKLTDPEKLLVTIQHTQKDIFHIIQEFVETAIQRGVQSVLPVNRSRQTNLPSIKSLKSLREALNHVLGQVSGLLCELSSVFFSEITSSQQIGSVHLQKPIDRHVFLLFAAEIMNFIARLSPADASLRLRQELLLDHDARSNEFQVRICINIPVD
ncbi:hypothetical protein Ciccas_013114 [Cichlidogyrus casuarinus]|uniref:Uncharacterized protein n=1 Tax=Cichlidogyrus casuarinus TaxID=1844966 RepID=A0ABD2PLJ2_9PLAT